MEFAEYIRFFFFFGLMLIAGGAFILISHLCQIRLKNEAYDWSKPYECGIQAYDYVPDRYPVHYYFVGIIFVVFDVEAVFMIPWAVSSGGATSHPDRSRRFEAVKLQHMWSSSTPVASASYQVPPYSSKMK